MELLLGAYLMGGLPEDDAAAVRAHLEICDMCRAEHDELAPVPGWLSLLSDAHERPHLTLAGEPDADDEAAGRKGKGWRRRGSR